MRFRKKEKPNEEETYADRYLKELEKEKRREKVIKVLKYIGTGAAVVAGGIAAAGIAALTASSKDDEYVDVNYDPHAFDRYYEPFADPDSPLYIEPDNVIDVDWDDFDYN